jgi:hypothetical protein
MMVRSNEPKLTAIVGTAAISAVLAVCEGPSAEWRTTPIAMAVPATANQITRRFHERGGCEVEPGSTFRGLPAASENGLISEGIPNLLDYYTIMALSTGVLRHSKVTALKGGAWEDDRR